MSFGRTLSGRPSLMVPPSPPPVALGGGSPLSMLGGDGAAGYLLSTASEAQAFADFDATRLAADFSAGRPGRAVRTAGGSPLSGGSGGGGGAFSISSGPFSSGSPASSGGASPPGTGRSGLSPITEQPAGVGANGGGASAGRR